MGEVILAISSGGKFLQELLIKVEYLGMVFDTVDYFLMWETGLN